MAWGDAAGFEDSAKLPRTLVVVETWLMGWLGARVALRGLAAAGAGALARPERPSLCTLPITALRVTPPPSSAAIWLALRPWFQSFFRSSTRSSVQDIGLILFRKSTWRNPFPIAASPPRSTEQKPVTKWMPH